MSTSGLRWVALAGLLACTPSPAPPPTAPGTLLVHRGDPPSLCTLDAKGGTPRCEDTTGRFAGPVHDSQVVVIETEESEGGHRERLIRWTAPNGEILPLTPWAPQVRSPVWSPDGSRLAVATTLGGASSLFALGSVGSVAPEVLHEHPGGSFEPDWYPDGQQVVFASSREGNAEIHSVPALGGEPKRLTDHPADDLRPRLSKRGTLAWLSERTGIRKVHRMTEGSATLLLPANPHPEVDLVWSPTDEQLAVVTGAGPDTAYVVVVDATSGEVVRTLGQGGERALEHPVWSPDGAWLAMTCRKDSVSGVCVASVDGTVFDVVLEEKGATWWLPRWM